MSTIPLESQQNVDDRRALILKHDSLFVMKILYFGIVCIPSPFGPACHINSTVLASEKFLFCFEAYKINHKQENIYQGSPFGFDALDIILDKSPEIVERLCVLFPKIEVQIFVVLVTFLFLFNSPGKSHQHLLFVSK